MAIGTLGLCYGNPEVFRGVVKMRRGEAAAMMTGLRSMADVYAAFERHATIVRDRCHGLGARRGGGAKVRAETARLCDEILERCAEGLARERAAGRGGDGGGEAVEWPVRVGLAGACGAYAAHSWGVGGVREALGGGGPTSLAVDVVHRVVSVVLFAVFLYVLATGRRLGTAAA